METTGKSGVLEFIKKMFGGLNMSWKNVIIFAVAAGVYTALMALLVPSNWSFHDIAVTFEVWILLAIIIISNCEKPLEAALKTFVFFLISQPLVYLIQVPFSDMGWSLFGYYRYWFFITLLTLPGAFIGWYIKKNNVLAGIILSVMLVLLVLLGVGFAKQAYIRFPYHLLSAIFCFAIIPIMIFGIFSDKKARLTAGIISIAALIVFGIASINESSMLTNKYINLDEEKYPLDENWSVSVENEKIQHCRPER